MPSLSPGDNSPDVLLLLNPHGHLQVHVDVHLLVSHPRPVIVLGLVLLGREKIGEDERHKSVLRRTIRVEG